MRDHEFEVDRASAVAWREFQAQLADRLVEMDDINPEMPRTDVALVIGADTTPKGAFAPVGGERKNDPDWQRFIPIQVAGRIPVDVAGMTSRVEEGLAATLARL